MPTDLPLIKYRTVIETPYGILHVDVASHLGPDAAARRAQWTIIAAREYGDVEDVQIISTHLVCTWSAMCDNQTTDTLEHPVFGEIPICARCYAAVGPQPA